MQVQDPVAVQNILALKKKEFEIKFDLSNSKYDPVETIGTGAYGVVCSAMHRVNKQRVAIKKIPDIFTQDIIAKRTLREVRILKHFKHDNIISIREILKPTEPLDKFRDIYIVLDLMESDMHRVIHSKQDLTDEHIRYFLYQILRGLKYIHSANVVHRDLKPSNLLVNENCDLKIGDFGMARGISSNPDEFNHMLTQYVATRWYRAPEIMMSTMAYSGAIDMWSVGCILAEMLGRRQLFPGRDYVDQLKLIIGIVGSPSIEFLTKIQSKNIRNFINGLGHKEPESFRKLYPKAKNKAINLLENMLVLDPTRRMSVEAALKHPYLSTYHDPDDEPVCIPTFDFSFEAKDLSAAELRECITKEIMDYHKPKPQLTFDFRPVPKSELLKTSPKVLKTTANPAFSKLDQEKCGQIAAQMRAKQVRTTSEKTDPQKETIKTQHLQPSETDIEMLSAKLSATKVEDSSMAKSKDEEKNVAIKTQQLQPSETDIEMLSAKLSATKVDYGAVEKVMKANDQQKEDVLASIVELKDKPTEETKPVNAKEALKMALLNARLSRQKGVEKKRPVTALQRQRENEEKKKKKLAKIKEKKRKEKEKESPMKLSSDDLQMLERWKTMQAKPDKSTKQKKPQAVTTGNSSLNNKSGNQATIQQGGNQAMLQQGGSQPTLQQGGNQVLLQQGDNQVTIQQGGNQATLQQGGNQIQQGFTTQPQIFQNSTQQAPAFTVPNFHANGGLGTTNQIPVDTTFPVPPASKEPPSYTEAIFGKNGTTPNPFAAVNTQPASVQPQEETLPSLDLSRNEPFAAYSQGMKHLSPSDLLFGNDPMLVSEPSSVSHPMAVTTSQFSAIPDPVFMQSNPVLHPQTSTFQADKSMTQPNPLPLPSNPTIPPPPQGQQPSTSNQPSGPSSHPSPNISEIPADFLNYLNKVSKVKGDDLTVHTPKGTGAGYGVGLDLDAILADAQPPGAESRLDSAPLSASLIQDWMDMTGNFDTKDLENLELEIGLPVGFNDLV